MIEYLLNDNVSLRDRNKSILKFLHDNIERTELLSSIINDKRIELLDISILKAMLIMLSNNKNINIDNLQKLYDIKFSEL